MKTTTTVRPLKKGYTSTGKSFGGSKQLPTITHVISSGGPVGLRHSLRGSAAGKIWKKTVLGDKFEFSKKLKEKKNYVLYTYGMGHEKKEIQEIEQIPQPPEKAKIVEERQIIDNYEYHETKNIKKNKNPRVASITHHERLSTPFERTVVKEYATKTSQQIQPKILSSTTVKKSQNSTSKSPYNSLTTTKSDKNKTITPSKLYETYKPQVNTKSYSQTKMTTIETPVKSNVNRYQTKTTTTKTTTKTTTNKNNEDIRKNVPNNLNKYSSKTKPDNKSPYNRTETEPNNKRGKPGSKPGDLPRSGSVPKGGIKPLGNVEKPRKDDKPRSGSKPLDRPKYEPKGPGHRGPAPQEPGRGPTSRPSAKGPGHRGPAPQEPRQRGPSSGPSTKGPGHRGPGPKEPRQSGPSSKGPGHRGPGPKEPGQRGLTSRPSAKEPGHRGPGPKEPERNGPASRPSAKGPRHRGPGPKEPGQRGPSSGPSAKGPGHRGPGPKEPERNGPASRPSAKEPVHRGPGPKEPERNGPASRPSAKGPVHRGPGPQKPGERGPGASGRPKPENNRNKPTKPDNKGPRTEFAPHGRPGHHGPHGPGGDYRPRSPKSQPKNRAPYNERTFPGSVNRPYIGKKYQERSDIQSNGLESPYDHLILSLDATPTIVLPDVGGDNYNYYESKNILKKHRRALPITIHQRRGDFGSTMEIPSKHERSSSYTNTKVTQKFTNLNRTFNASKPEITTKYTQSTYQVKNSTTLPGTKQVKEAPKKVERPKREPMKVEPPKKVEQKREKPKREPIRAEPPKKVEPPKKERPKREPMKVEPPKKVAPPKKEKPKREPIRTVTPKKETVTKSVSRREIGGGDGKGTSSYSEYRRYEQKGNLSSGKNNRSQMNQSTDYKKYQLNKSSETRQSGTGQFGSRNASNVNKSYEFNQKTEYKYSLPMGGLPQFQILDDEYMIINCPVHGKQKVRRDRFKKFF